MTKPLQPSLFQDGSTHSQAPLECLGLTFENDEARRTYFSEKLREKLQEPEFHQSEGFPVGAGEDILAMSDPPYYTACSNPFFEEFVKAYARPYDPIGDDYHRTPLTVDISAGKNDPIYQAHAYATKVPYQAIVQAILHYTSPGDVVLDGFAGSGMVGVAAEACNHPPEALKQTIENDWEADGMPPWQWGARRAILNDLSPIASFISANYSLPFDADEFSQAALRIIEETKQELGWMYETLHTDSQTRGHINYTVWSELFVCPACDREINFFDQALDDQTKRIMGTFSCPHCQFELTRRKLKRSYEHYFDPVLAKSTQRLKRRPALISYIIESSRLEKLPDQDDLATLRRVESLSPWPVLPTYEVPVSHQSSQRARFDNLKITHIHQFYLPRTAFVLGVVWQKIQAVDKVRLRHILMFWFDNLLPRLSVQNRYHPDGHSSVLPHLYYVPPLISEMNPFKVFEGAIRRLTRAFSDYKPTLGNTIIGTGDTGQLNSIPNNSIDYIFTDPPVFDYIYYSDLNFLVESWYKVWTNIEAEAVVNQARAKGLLDYQRLMSRCFKEYHRTLKPNRWITIIFPSARARIWKLIQEAIVAAGFIVAGACGVGDRHRSYHKIASTSVRQSLVISAYKPSLDLEEHLASYGSTEEVVWNFVMNHLKQLPICLRSDDNMIEVIDERLNYNLFERAQTFFAQRGFAFPLSTPEFYTELDLQFPARDDMYFQSKQVVEYDRWRIEAKSVQKPKPQFVDEARAIGWLQAQLFREPQTTQEIRSSFENSMIWVEEDQRLNLDDLLAQNFRYYQGRWHLPEPNELEALESQRRLILLEKFREIRSSKSKIKPSQIEAVRTGFKQAIRDDEFETIIEMSVEIPDDVLIEYPDLLWSYDQAVVHFEI
jgi:hypothetical protein